MEVLQVVVGVAIAAGRNLLADFGAVAGQTATVDLGPRTSISRNKGIISVTGR